ncbi:MAG: acyltransferase [Eubacteriales bacterium]|nr:acyltransferase [Eubacteriales bacterium]
MSELQAAGTPRGREFYLDAARAVAILSISMNHAVNRTYQNFGSQYYEFIIIPRASTVVKVFAIVFGHLGVPLFLMISGALLLRKNMSDEGDVRRFYRHNLLPLLITTEVWYVLMYWFIQAFALPTEDTGSGGIGGMLSTMLFVNQTTMDSMWYMPMILCLYLIIPLCCILRKHVSYKVLALPTLLVFLSEMVIPNLNAYFKLADIDMELEFVLRASNLFSMYFLYVLAGYWISQGGMKRLKTWMVAAGAALSFAFCWGFQYYACGKPETFSLDYDFAMLLVCAMFTFELFRRAAPHIKHGRGAITYLARISFGVYFVHILIMSYLEWHVYYHSWPRPAAMLFLEAVSVGGSIAVIALLSRIPACRKYLFMIK